MTSLPQASMRHSVATRILLIVLALYLLIVTVVSLGHVWADYHYHACNIEQDMQAIGRAYEKALGVGLWTLDEEALAATVRGVLNTPPLVGVKVVGDEGKIVALGGVVSTLGETGQVGLHVNIAGCDLHAREVHAGEESHLTMLEYSFDIVYVLDDAPVRLGVATIYSSSGMIYRRMKVQLLMQAINVLVTLLTFSVALLATMHHYLRKPLRILTDATAGISLDNLGSFSIDSSSLHPNEIKVLEEALTSMVGNLHRSFLYRDATERELRQLRNYLANIVDSMPSVLVGVDPAGNVTQWNRAAEQATGLPAIDALGKPLEQAFPRLGNEMDAVREAIESQQVRRDSTRQIDRGGDATHEDMTVFPLVAKGVNGAVIRLDDVTERVRLEGQETLLRERLCALERRQALGVLAGGVAHDLNNIMGPIVMLPDLIDEVLERARTATDEEIAGARRDLSMMLDSAQRAAIVIEGLQSLGQRGHVELQPLEINGLIGSCLATHDVRSLHDRRPELTITSRLHAGELTIQGNSTDLHRVLLNLIVNAADAIVDKGRILIESEAVSLAEETLGYEPIAPGDYVTVQVRDTGAGIPDDLLKVIFDPFVSSKRNAAGADKGSGLGLSVVHAIMKDHGGSIDVMRDQDGWSTSFVLYFPACSSPVDDAADVPPESLAGGGRERILVVDDVWSQRVIARRGLERAGYRVEEAANGHAALDFFDEDSQSEGKIDLVVLDMIMEPDFDGLDTYRAILERQPDQKVIFVSGHAPVGRGEAAQALGASWLNKPYLISALVRHVRDALDKA
jgi:PAS domain S-box-containing protein